MNGSKNGIGGAKHRALQAEFKFLTDLINNHEESQRPHFDNKRKLKSHAPNRFTYASSSNMSYKKPCFSAQSAYKIVRNEQTSLTRFCKPTSLQNGTAHANPVLQCKSNLLAPAVGTGTHNTDSSSQIFNHSLKSCSKRTVVYKPTLVPKRILIDKSSSSNSLVNEIIAVTQQLKQKNQNISKAPHLIKVTKNICTETIDKQKNSPKFPSYKAGNLQKSNPELKLESNKSSMNQVDVSVGSLNEESDKSKLHTLNRPNSKNLLFNDLDYTMSGKGKKFIPSVNVSLEYFKPNMNTSIKDKEFIDQKAVVCKTDTDINGLVDKKSSIGSIVSEIITLNEAEHLSVTPIVSRILKPHVDNVEINKSNFMNSSNTSVASHYVGGKISTHSKNKKPVVSKYKLNNISLPVDSNSCLMSPKSSFYTKTAKNKKTLEDGKMPLTAISTIDKKQNQVFDNKSSSSKKKKLLDSKYKVINKNTPKSSFQILSHNKYDTPKRSLASRRNSMNLKSPYEKMNNPSKKKLSDNKLKNVMVSKYKVINRDSFALKQSNGEQALIMSENHLAKLKMKQAHIVSSVKSVNVLNSKYRLVNANFCHLKVSCQSSCERQFKGKTDLKIRSQKKGRKLLSSKYKVVNKNSPIVILKKPTSEQCIVVQTPLSMLKKPKNSSVQKTKRLLNSKYKVINKSLAVLGTKEVKCDKDVKNDHFMHTKKRVSFGRTKKLLNSRYTIVNKKSSPTEIKPYQSLHNIKHILVKRIYKSPRTVINKNLSPINQVAKMIKTKYHIVNKNRQLCAPLPMYNHSSSRQLQRTRNFSGHSKKYYHYYPSNSYNFQQKRWKVHTPIARTKRNYFKHLPKETSFLRIGDVSYKVSKTKMSKTCRKTGNSFKNVGYKRSPVLVIRGVRFAIDPSGKTLRRLSCGNDGKKNESPKKLVLGGKTFIRIAPDLLTEATPVTKTLASRALNRSIHRVLTASTRKNMKTNTYCMFYNRFGRCNRGVKCPYIHDPSKIAVCTRFLRGTCKIDGCPFSHEVSPGKMAVCSFFLLGSCNKKECPYRHETIAPGTKLCTAFVQGYCSKGKECKKAHILVCPHYIQGNCQMGTSCVYPHPPQKTRKSDGTDDKSKKLKKAEENQDDIIETDDIDLLDKVSRYFLFEPFIKETATELDNNCNITCEVTENDEICHTVVSRMRKLPTLPSFIPLSIKDDDCS